MENMFPHVLIFYSMGIRRLEKILEPFFEKITAKNIKYAQNEAKNAWENASLFTQIHQKRRSG